ncbi:MAG: ABC transporter ATP-binding protein [Oscillospiraceae bacterium]|nr:ABC transporter ATP-binding protein [Oscillospiraceae bacterium]
MASVTFKNIWKKFPNDLIAVKDFNLEIKDKEVIVFLGPSGCGKTTTLRMIAGLEEISEGELYIGDKLVNEVHPKDRDIAMVFYNYALFPHMTVYENIAFGLKPIEYPENEIKEKVEEVARIFDITHLLERKKRELSGGQQQRVALARALICKRKVILLDEPLSNLDAKLRAMMRIELIKIHQQFGMTFVYVTHDQAEAMALADRLVIMKDGFIQQVGTPEEVYNNPVNLFVAGFIGTPQINMWETNVFNLKLPKIREVITCVRPEDLYIDENGAIEAEVKVREFRGDNVYLYFDNFITMRVPPSCKAKTGDKLKISVNPDKIYLFDKETELAIKN